MQNDFINVVFQGATRKRTECTKESHDFDRFYGAHSSLLLFMRARPSSMSLEKARKKENSIGLRTRFPLHLVVKPLSAE